MTDEEKSHPSDSIHGYRSDTERVLTTDEYDCLYSPEHQDRQQVTVFKQNQLEKKCTEILGSILQTKYE